MRYLLLFLLVCVSIASDVHECDLHIFVVSDTDIRFYYDKNFIQTMSLTMPIVRPVAGNCSEAFVKTSSTFHKLTFDDSSAQWTINTIP